MRKLLLTILVVYISVLQSLGQSRTVTGKVLDDKDKGTPVVRANILTQDAQVGTTTNDNGNFSITVPANTKSLIVSAANHITQAVDIIGKNEVIVVLQRKNEVLTEVVITALGIARDKRSLSYATQTIKADQLANKGSVNLIDALQGKLTGTNITNASGAAGASVNINIRGITSFEGSNQPLIVVDGIPISNDVDRTANTLFDNQPANRLLDLDVNNIESVNILKGPAASVLYGSRAAGGVISITTKKGSGKGGRVEVIVNTSYAVQNVIGLPKVQNEYGQGANGVYNPISANSWGPRFGSTPTVANGLLVGGTPITGYQAYPDNISDFFEQGVMTDLSLQLNAGDAKQNFTASISNNTNKGILPNNEVKRTSLKFGGNTILREKISLGGSINYINTIQDGIVGGNGGSALAVLAGLARNIDLTTYKTNGTYKNANGSNNFLIPNVENPYFGANENTTQSNVSRFLGSISVGYDVFKWLNISYRLGLDAYTDRRKNVYAVTSIRQPAGQIVENTLFRSEINGDLIITAKKNDLFIKSLNVTGLLGQNFNQRIFQNTLLQGDGLAFPGFYNISNATTFTNGSGELNSMRRLLGYYAQASFAYNNYLFLELTGRIDKSSTLPKEKAAYFYPSVSAGFVFTDAFNIKPAILSYGKIRASIAKVGRDAEPYLLQNVFVSGGYGNNVAAFSFPLGTTAGFGASTRIAPIEPISPEFTTSTEVGINLGFFKNRLSIDFAYFDQVSKDQIINVGLAPSTGYSSKTMNVGEMTNKGYEALVNITPISSKSFKWDVSVNYTKIINKVVSIAPGIKSFSIVGNAFNGSVPSIKEGFPYGVILGGVIPRSPSGERLINPTTGLYQPTIAGEVLADPNPDYSMGFTNSFTYKGISLSATFDFTKGGQILSFTSATYKARGAWEQTAIDREQPRILPGVIEFPAGSGTYIPNNIQLPAQTYWQVLGGLQSEFNVYDATVFRFRELSLGYDLPKKILGMLHLTGARFSVFGRNLFYVAPNAILDPAVNTQGAGNIRGLELQSAPNARTLGANLKIAL